MSDRTRTGARESIYRRLGFRGALRAHAPRFAPLVLLALLILTSLSLVHASGQLLKTASGQTSTSTCQSTSCIDNSRCFNDGCITYYTLEVQIFSPGTNITYTWKNTNTCGTFYPNYQTPTAKLQGSATWVYGGGVYPVCFAPGTATVDFNGTITVDITSGPWQVICTDPNGASGSDYSSGPVGSNTCAGNVIGVRAAPFNVTGFDAAQTYVQPESYSSTTLTTASSSQSSSTATSTSTTASTSTVTPVSNSAIAPYVPLIVFIVALALISFGYVYRQNIGGTKQDPPPPTSPSEPIPPPVEEPPPATPWGPPWDEPRQDVPPSKMELDKKTNDNDPFVDLPNVIDLTNVVGLSTPDEQLTQLLNSIF